MPVLTITKTYQDGAVLAHSDLDSALDSVSTFLNTTKIDSANIQDAGVTNACLAASAVAASNLAANAVTTSAIAAAAVTGSNIASATITGGNVASATITGSNIASATITGGNVASATITGSNIASATIAGSNIASATIAGSNIASNVALAGTPTSASETLMVAAANYSTSTRMVYGWVAAAGGAVGGAGFTSSKTATGTYLVTFNTSMSTDPFVAIAPIYVSTPFIAMQSIIDHGGFSVRCFDLSGSAIDADFSFVAVGPR